MLQTRVLPLAATIVALVMMVAASQPVWATTVITENFDSEPATWWGQENRIIANDFGWSNTNIAEGVMGIGTGEIGGTFSRANAAAYWTDVVSLDLSSDSLTFSGRGQFVNGWQSDGNSMLGWYDSTASLSWVPDNYMGIRTDTNEVYLEYVANGGTLYNAKLAGPLPGVDENGGSWTFELNYDPAGNNGDGVVTASINGGASVAINLAAGDKDAMTNLDRFGLLTLGNGGSNVKEVYYDDLSYTSAAVPEPSVLVGLAVLPLMLVLRRRRNSLR